uniref:Uncharacterized protein n=1 Tax=Bicosoecida sp. CB-2014 TaxID=1486930 RepID=A0A7S1CLK3_9STRA|mmetsp:Transcript_5481/g.19656  ORF Transcript_5481/g.19656 Transcript_5481/m.19656 type:complete len:196 (+) Transcript_5481:140-727(+)
MPPKAAPQRLDSDEEAEIEAARRRGEGKPPKGEPRDWGRILTRFLCVVSVLAIIAALLTAAAHAAVLFSIGIDADRWYELLTRIAGIGWAALVIMTELKVGVVFNYLKIMSLWLARGVLYIYLGGVVLNSNTRISTSLLPVGDADTVKAVVDVAGYSLMAVGALYCLMEVMCLRRVAMRRARGDAVERAAANTRV